MISRRGFLLASAAIGAQGLSVGPSSVAQALQGLLQTRSPHSPFSFIDVATAAGLNVLCQYGEPLQKKFIVETLGCGCAFLDYDNDGWLDVVLLSGNRLDQPNHASCVSLFKNNRDGSFTDVTTKSGLAHSGWATGICIADFDNDGHEDIFITEWGTNRLFRNQGDGTFADVTEKAGLAGSHSQYGSGCTFVDYDRDGFVDLVVTRYAQFDLETAPRPGQTEFCRWKGVPVNCGPRGLGHGSVSLYHNNGNGTFTDVSTPSGIGKSRSSYCLTAIAADFDNDGWTDIFVACDSTPNLLFLNNRNGSFREAGSELGVAYGAAGNEQAGMGVAVGDFFEGGRLDVLKTNFSGDITTLYRNSVNGFDDVSNDAGLGLEHRFVSWGCGLEDLDNDGLLDALIVTGNVYPEMERAHPDEPAKSPRLLFRNTGKFALEEVATSAESAIAAAHNSRGCAFGDFDNDGDLDVLIVNLGEAPSLLRNDTVKRGHWLKVKLVGTKTNRSAIGARIAVNTAQRTQIKDVLSQSSFLSANDLRQHFGLGDATSAHLRVRWTNGAWEEIGEVRADRLITIREGVGIVPNVGWA